MTLRDVDGAMPGSDYINANYIKVFGEGNPPGGNSEGINSQDHLDPAQTWGFLGIPKDLGFSPSLPFLTRPQSTGTHPQSLSVMEHYQKWD